MQNRLVITGIPSSVPSLPFANEALRDLVEEHGCWVDRFAFIIDQNQKDEDGREEHGPCQSVVAVAELHIENIRDRAVKKLNGLSITLQSDESSCTYRINNEHSPNRGEKDGREDDSLLYHYNHTTEITDMEPDRNDIIRTVISFTIFASKCSQVQARRLVECCPLDTNLEDVVANDRMVIQTLKLPNSIELTVRRSGKSGGTGTYPWRSGLILAQQICIWLKRKDMSIIRGCKKRRIEGICGQDFTRELFHNKDVLELGAGCAGLPSMALAVACQKYDGCHDISIRRLVASDGIDEIVQALNLNVKENNLNDCICVKHIDWNHLLREDGDSIQSDTIIFADCVYNEEGATALCYAIQSILKPGGNILGVLPVPDCRVGLDSFERSMQANGFHPRVIPRVEEEASSAFACSGVGGKHNRLLWWKDCRE